MVDLRGVVKLLPLHMQLYSIHGSSVELGSKHVHLASIFSLNRLRLRKNASAICKNVHVVPFKNNEERKVIYSSKLTIVNLYKNRRNQFIYLLSLSLLI